MAQPGWVRTGEMFDARLMHTATLLNDGRVLVTGGTDGAATLTSAEVYDPQAAEWSRTQAMREPRFGHTATLLGDGRVLVAGGYGAAGVSGGYGPPASPEVPTLSTAEIYAPSSGTWARAPSMVETHAEHTANLLADGRVFIAYGVGDGDDFTGAMSQVLIEFFDPAANSWTFTDRGYQRYQATTTALPAGGYFLLFGGTCYDGFRIQPQYTANVYDPVADSGFTVELANPRALHTATALKDGTVLMAGGATVSSDNPSNPAVTLANTPVEERFDPASFSLQPTASMRDRRHRHTATLLSDGTVLVAGGGFFTATSGPPDLSVVEALASSEVYSPGTAAQPSASWASAGSLLQARLGHTATLLNDGTVLAAGGSQAPRGGVLSTAERYFPDLSGLSGCAGAVLGWLFRARKP